MCDRVIFSTVRRKQEITGSKTGTSSSCKDWDLQKKSDGGLFSFTHPLAKLKQSKPVNIYKIVATIRCLFHFCVVLLFLITFYRWFIPWGGRTTYNGGCFIAVEGEESHGWLKIIRPVLRHSGTCYFLFAFTFFPTFLNCTFSVNIFTISSRIIYFIDLKG